jgi:hypothetical protein
MSGWVSGWVGWKQEWRRGEVAEARGGSVSCTGQVWLSRSLCVCVVGGGGRGAATGWGGEVR